MMYRSQLNITGRPPVIGQAGRLYQWNPIRGIWALKGGPLSLGMYPGDACFDSARPDWVPYWFDTPTESGCKYRLYNVTSLATPPAPPGGQPPGAPQTLTQMTVPGAYTPDQSMTAAHDATVAANLSFFQQLAQSPAFGGGNPPAGACDPWYSFLNPGCPGIIPAAVWWLAIAAAALVLFRR